MNENEKMKVVDAWIQVAELVPYAGMVSAAVRDDPGLALELIVEIASRDISKNTALMLSAGPLQDLLAKHGRACIGQAENIARSNSRFKSLLACIRKIRLEKDIWNRVCQASK